MEELLCNKCKTINESGYRYCKKCGTLLVDPQPSPANNKMANNQSSNNKKAQTELSSRSIDQLGMTGTTLVNPWQPFAGFGEREHHETWLLDNLGDRAEDLRDSLSDRFVERKIPGAEITRKRLSGKGFLTECRDYYIAKRKHVSVGVLIARFGKDLYISQVTYFKGPISTARLLIYLLMLAFQVLFVIGITSFYSTVQYGVLTLSSTPHSTNPNDLQEPSLAPPQPDQDFTALFNIDKIINTYIQKIWGLMQSIALLACCLSPLGILNMIVLAISTTLILYRAVTRKDLLSIFRQSPNLFQEDDRAALEWSVYKTIGESLDKIGISSAVLPPLAEYKFKRRVI